MPKLKFTMTTDPDKNQTHITLYHGAKPLMANSESHPNWEKIRAGILADDPKVVDLFTYDAFIQRRVLSERVTMADGRLYFDHDELDDALTKHIVRLFDSGEAEPWVLFLEKVMSNPNPESRKHLYTHLKRHNYSIYADGDYVGYKGVKFDRMTGKFLSTRSGPAIINGTIHKDGYVPQGPGDIIAMARSEVTFDPHNACAQGLHVSGYDYARTYGATVLEVKVNPRDVVSVPLGQEKKVRVCRYQVVGPVPRAYSGAVRPMPTILFEPNLTVQKVPKTVKAGAPGFATGDSASDAKYPRICSGDSASDAKLRKTTPSKEQSVSAVSKRVRYPRPGEFEALASKAKAQKKGLTRFLQSKTNWTLIDGRSGTDRKDWAV